MPGISRVLASSRGTIATRVIRACQGLGIETVLAVSGPDRESLPAKMVDRAVRRGPVPPLKNSISAETRVTAVIEHMRNALKRFFMSGVDKAIPFLSSLIHNTVFVTGTKNTHWKEEMVNS